jgi:hypothetical protein
MSRLSLLLLAAASMSAQAFVRKSLDFLRRVVDGVKCHTGGLALL